MDNLSGCASRRLKTYHLYTIIPPTPNYSNWNSTTSQINKACESERTHLQWWLERRSEHISMAGMKHKRWSEGESTCQATGSGDALQSRAEQSRGCSLNPKP
ncbi:hypothetical protein M758_5G128100 [Ceratodon purpureus]|nr:hypothetical protein M758_5G128100 [Ceratodon purpureus]